MTWRESHRPAPETLRVDDASGTTGAMVARDVLPVDPPAPTTPAAPIQGAAGATSSLAAWMIRHAREDVDHGRALPDGLSGLLRTALADPLADNCGCNQTRWKIEPRTHDRHPLSQVAERFGLAKRTLRHLAETGQVHAWQRGPGCNWLIDPESVAEYLQARRTKTSDPTEPPRGDRG